jgi:hypothetical protein
LKNGGLHWNQHKNLVQVVYKNISIIEILNLLLHYLNLLMEKLVELAAAIIDQWLQRS